MALVGRINCLNGVISAKVDKTVDEEIELGNLMEQSARRKIGSGASMGYKVAHSDFTARHLTE